MFIFSGISSAAECQLCLAGFYCKNGASAPTRCLAGFYCPNGTATPLPCPDSNNKDKAYYGCPGLINLVGVYMRKKHPGYSPVNLVPRLAGMILILIYMKSFVPVYRDENLTWYCSESSSV